ncbi:MAG: class I SAM-dependent methyltransferase [Rudaea sp.]
MSDAPNPTASRDHFLRIVPQWSHFGPPLRPSPDDTAVVQRAASRLSADAHVVVLGLTPETIGCIWPAETQLSAVDHSADMIRALWPPVRGPAHARVVLADWCAMPIPSETIDLVAGDGCYVLQKYPDGYDALTRDVARILRPGGAFIIRVFIRPDRSESIADIARALERGEIGGVHALKLRLLASLHGASGAGSRLDDAWQAWKSMPALPDARKGTRGWTAEEIAGIETYRGMDARYFLPTLAELRQTLGNYVREVECAYGRHELADRCPTLVLIKDA